MKPCTAKGSPISVPQPGLTVSDLSVALTSMDDHSNLCLARCASSSHTSLSHVSRIVGHSVDPKAFAKSWCCTPPNLFILLTLKIDEF